MGLGPDGRVWFSGLIGEKLPDNREVAYGALYEIGPTGVVLRFRYPNPGGYPGPFVTGPDRALWIVGGSGLERYVPGGALTAYTLPGGSLPTSITPGPEGALWFTTLDGKIGRITTSGEIKLYLIEDGDTAFGEVGYMEPSGIAYGPDGALWFAELTTGRIGRMTASGEIEEYPLPNPHGAPGYSPGAPFVRELVAGPDGAMWFTDSGNEAIGRISMSGQITEYPLPPTPHSALVPELALLPTEPRNLVFGPEGQGWFTETARELGTVNLTAMPASGPAKAAVRTKRAKASKNRRSCSTSAVRHVRRNRGQPRDKSTCRRAKPKRKNAR
jgi:virginiamycin B lyase